MATLISGSINLNKLPKDKIQRSKSGDQFYNFTVSVEDTTSEYGDNCGIYDAQTKEERAAKVKRNYTGNGRVVWTDGNVTTAEKVENKSQPKAKEEQDVLPF
tara:strand:- start:109 stop:414 length:306 start_codon:yes stop_codon:yes gene_type:complete